MESNVDVSNTTHYEPSNAVESTDSSTSDGAVADIVTSNGLVSGQKKRKSTQESRSGIFNNNKKKRESIIIELINNERILRPAKSNDEVVRTLKTSLKNTLRFDSSATSDKSVKAIKSGPVKDIATLALYLGRSEIKQREEISTRHRQYLDAFEQTLQSNVDSVSDTIMIARPPLRARSYVIM
jgi:hypothetical protein